MSLYVSDDKLMNIITYSNHKLITIVLHPWCIQHLQTRVHHTSVKECISCTTSVMHCDLCTFSEDYDSSLFIT